MITGLGVDIVENKRFLNLFKKYGSHFLEKIFTSREISQLSTKNPLHLCGLFAAKEAVIKALRNGRHFKFGLWQIELISKNNSYQVKNWPRISLSISHERLFSVAVAFLNK